MIHSSSKQDRFENISSEKGKMVDSSNSCLESSRILSFLRKVFKDELGDRVDQDKRKPMLLELTIRAVLLDCGFVKTDPASKSTLGNVQRSWYFPTFYYTLPDIITHGKTETVEIKFQHLGPRHCRVYGSVVGGTMVRSVRIIEKAKLVLFLNVVWANCERVLVVMKKTNRATKIQPEKEVLEFWRKFKYKFVLPLLTDLCEKAGLKDRPCFMGLPDELKLKILESICGADLARVSCVSSKLRCLTSNDDLWNQKLTVEFPQIVHTDTTGLTSKERFGSSWRDKINRIKSVADIINMTNLLAAGYYELMYA